jgi:hypothetical protein
MKDFNILNHLFGKSFSNYHNNIQRNIEYTFYWNHINYSMDQSHILNSKYIWPWKHHNNNFFDNIYRLKLRHLNYKLHIYQLDLNNND